MRRVSLRPCSFPTVSARARAGGGVHGAEGGKRPEGLLDDGFQGPLIVLDDEPVMIASLDDRPARRPLGKHRVGDDDPAAKRLDLQQGQLGDDLVAIGISGGGRTTKIHAAVDGRGRPLGLAITGGNVHDGNAAEAALRTPRPPVVVTPDKGYDSEKCARPSGTTVGRPRYRAAPTPNGRHGVRRHEVENFICAIEDWRRIATRYDKLARNFLAAASMVAVLCWVRS
jgi:transposase